MKVSDVMTRGVISLTPDDTLQKAARLMLLHEVSGFPVLDNGKLVGILTEGDFLRRVETGTERPRCRWIEMMAEPGRLAEEYARVHGRKVGDVMTREVVTVTEGADLEEAVGLMEAHHVKRLPVVKDNAMVGIISRSNLVRAFILSSRQTAGVASDIAIREQLMAELKRLPWAAASNGCLTLLIENGIVNFEGLVADERQRTALRIAAENIPGVVGVHDHLIKVASSPPGQAPSIASRRLTSTQ